MTTRESSRLSTDDQRVVSLLRLIDDRRFAFVGSVVLLAIVWQLIATYAIDPKLISSPVRIVEELYSLLIEGLLLKNMWLTIQRTFYAMVATILIGTSVGLLAGWNDFWKGMFQDYIIGGLSMPTLLAAVFAAMWFGTSPLTPMVAASLLSFPFLAQNVKNAIENIDSGLIKMCRAFDVSRNRAIRHVVIWSVLPEWFSGMRNAFTVAWKIVTIAEFVGIPNGVGFYIVKSYEIFSMDGVLAWTLSFSFIIIVIEFTVFETLERWLFAWREEASMSFA